MSATTINNIVFDSLSDADKRRFSDLGKLKGGLAFLLDSQRETINNLNPEIPLDRWQIKSLQHSWKQLEELLREVS